MKIVHAIFSMNIGGAELMLTDIANAQADAGITGVADNAEGVGAGGNPDPFHILLHIPGQAAGIAGENEAHLLRLLHIGDGGSGAHQDNVRVSQLFGNVSGDVQAIAAAGVAKDDIFTHFHTSLIKKCSASH